MYSRVLYLLLLVYIFCTSPAPAYGLEFVETKSLSDMVKEGKDVITPPLVKRFGSYAPHYFQVIDGTKLSGEQKIIYHNPLSEGPHSVYFENLYIERKDTLHFRTGVWGFLPNSKTDQLAPLDDSDGVRFKIDIFLEGALHPLFEQEVSSFNQWFDHKVNLDKYSGSIVRLVLTTEPIGNTHQDWAYWGNPKIVAKTSVRETINRLRLKNNLFSEKIKSLGLENQNLTNDINLINQKKESFATNFLSIFKILIALLVGAGIGFVFSETTRSNKTQKLIRMVHKNINNQSNIKEELNDKFKDLESDISLSKDLAKKTLDLLKDPNIK